MHAFNIPRSRPGGITVNAALSGVRRLAARPFRPRRATLRMPKFEPGQISPGIRDSGLPTVVRPELELEAAAGRKRNSVSAK